MSETEVPKKKRGRKPKIVTGDVMIPVEPKQPKHKKYEANKQKKEKKLPELEEKEWEQFEKLCGYQCTSEEIADFFKLDQDRFSEMVKTKYKKPYEKVYKIFSAPGLCALRRAQFVLAKNNSQMAMWLGKIYLGQVDPAHKKAEETVDRLSTILEQIDEETKKIIAQKDDLHHSMF